MSDTWFVVTCITYKQTIITMCQGDVRTTREGHGELCNITKHQSPQSVISDVTLGLVLLCYFYETSTRVKCSIYIKGPHTNSQTDFLRDLSSIYCRDFPNKLLKSYHRKQNIECLFCHLNTNSEIHTDYLIKLPHLQR